MYASNIDIGLGHRIIALELHYRKKINYKLNESSCLGHPGGCERNSVGYRITCQACQGAGSWTQYEGESGRNAYSRGLEHQQDLRNEKEDSPLWKHCQVQHEGIKQTFYMEALRSFSSCLARQINEAVRLTSSSATIIMDSNSDFHQAPIVRVVVSSGLELEQGGEEAPQRGRGMGAGRGRGRAGSGVGRGAGGERQMGGDQGVRSCTFTFLYCLT